MAKTLKVGQITVKEKSCPISRVNQEILTLLGDASYNVKHIARQYNMKPNSVYKIFYRLKQKGLITKEKMLTETGIKCVQSTDGYSQSVQLSVHNKIKMDSVRGHNLVFKVGLPYSLERQWKNTIKRRSFLQKRDISFKKIGNNWEGESIFIKNRKVWFTPKGLIFYMGQYYADDAPNAMEMALDELIELIAKVEAIFKINIKGASGYRIKVSRQHYSLVKNTLAKQYNKDNKKFYCKDDDGLWMIIDNSFNLNELETVHPTSALDDNIVVQDFFNDLKENPTTTHEIWKAIGKVTQNQQMFAKNIDTHMEVLKDIGTAIKNLNNTVKKNSKI